MKTIALVASAALFISTLNSWVTFQNWNGSGGAIDIRSPTPGRSEIRLIPNGENDIAGGELTIFNSDLNAHPKSHQLMAISGRKDSFYFQSLASPDLKPLQICFDPRGGAPTLCLLPNGDVEIHGQLYVNGKKIK